MSIFVRVRPDGGESRYLRIRGMYGTIGRDVQGSISNQPDTSPLFTIFCSTAVVAVRTEQAARLPSGETLGAGSVIWRAPPITLFVEDTEVEIGSTSTAAEALAEAGAPPDDFDPGAWPVISYAVAGMAHEYLLPPRIPLTIGSSPNAPVCIPLEVIADEHTKVEFDGTAVTMTPLGGACFIEGRALEAAEMIGTTATVFLGASRLPLTIRLRP